MRSAVRRGVVVVHVRGSAVVARRDGGPLCCRPSARLLLFEPCAPTKLPAKLEKSGFQVTEDDGNGTKSVTRAFKAKVTNDKFMCISLRSATSVPSRYSNSVTFKSYALSSSNQSNGKYRSTHNALLLRGCAGPKTEPERGVQQNPLQQEPLPKQRTNQPTNERRATYRRNHRCKARISPTTHARNERRPRTERGHVRPKDYNQHRP